jgi:hypothetical protein
MTAITRTFLAAALAWAVSTSPAPAQQDKPEPEAQPEETTEAPSTTDDEAEATPLSAKAIEVVGDVTTAPVGTSPLDGEAWKKVKVNDELASGTMIRTGIRSHLILQFGDDTIINVRRVTLASIDAFYKTETTKTTRLGLGYGAIRGGSTEGTLRGDLVIDSTVATLAKRGTQGFEMVVEPYTGRFNISLARQGLVEALQKATGQRRLVRPGEYANELNIATMWVKQEQFDRNVRFVASEALSTSDLDFSTANARGLATVAPGAGDQVTAFAQRAEREFVLDQVSQQLARPTTAFNQLLPDLVVVEQGPVRRAEGNFGVSDTVRVLVPDTQGKRQFRRFFHTRPTQKDVDRWTRKRLGRNRR